MSDLLAYQQGNVESDILVAQWWGKMREQGDLERVFNRPPSLGRFLESLKSPTELLLGVDAEGVWFAAWFEPFFDGAMFSIWSAERARYSKKSLALFIEVLELGLKFYPALFTVTKQEHLVGVQEKVGFRKVAEIPGFFAGEDAWIMLLTKIEWDHGSDSRSTWIEWSSRRRRDGGSGSCGSRRSS